MSLVATDEVAARVLLKKAAAAGYPPSMTRLAILDRGRIVAAGAPRELISRNIEPQVVEVYGDGVLDWASSNGARLSERCEASGETVFCYAQDAAPLVAELENRPDLRYLHRHANLEDVFLKLTGRELRD